MIELNLLPDVKMQYVRSRRMKHTIVLICLLASAAAIFVLVVMFLVVNVAQKTHLSNVNKDIDTNTKKLQSITDLDKILTIQNQLNSLPELHDSKPVTSRVFTYVGQIVPAKITIAKLNLDFTLHTISFDGSTDTLNTINTFVDTLKFTTYKIEGGTDTPKAFSNVVLTSFSRSDTGADFTISANFSEAIFESANNVALTVPQQVTTRSETEKPTDLFKTPTNTGSDR